jgi:signal peptidase I
VSKRPFGCLFEVIETLVLTAVIYLVINSFIASPYRVQQQSMEHTLEPDQYILVDKLTPRFDTFKTGDIVVFNPPEQFSSPDGVPYIKRVIGVGGDTVEIRDDGFVYVNGVKLNESSYVFKDEDGNSQPTVPPNASQSKWAVPKGDLFVLGDHRMSSADSRVFGPITLESVIGRAWLRYWPFNSFGILPTPAHPELSSAAP